jgi:N-methylhydantoinase A/oxoprolinase/acetone carboxylase beta subunit
VRAPSIDVRTVGAGGGSISYVPELTRALRVGPQSAGAAPGPAAYRKGGELPTVTDANVVLGYLPSNAKLGGDMTIDRDLAAKAVGKIADALGMSLEKAAEGIVNIVNENMCGALRLVSVEQGYDPRDFAPIGFGGAGPLHANCAGETHQFLAGGHSARTRRALRVWRCHNTAAGRSLAHARATFRDAVGRQDRRHVVRSRRRGDEIAGCGFRHS